MTDRRLTETPRCRILPNAEAAANELGIERILGAVQAFGWYVHLSRQGQLIFRKFQDGSYGGWREALAEALAYRDAILSALPPHTYHEINERKLTGETPGVQERSGRWCARVHVDGKRQTRSFSIARFGRAGAKERAISAWHEMVASKSSSQFHTHSSKSAEIATALFSDRLNHNTVQPLSQQEVKNIIARINTEFDARRPNWIRVSVTMALKEQRVRVYVSGGSTTPRQKSFKNYRIGQSTLSWVLEGPVQAFIEETLTAIYDRDTAITFLETHGLALNGNDFDPVSGYNVRVKWPLREVREPAVSECAAAYS